MQAITTIELAKLLRVTPQTIRTNLCLHGHYMDLRPTKMPNRFLLWDAEQAQALIRGESPDNKKATA